MRTVGKIIGGIVLLTLGIAIGSVLSSDRCWLARLPFGSEVTLDCIARDLRVGLTDAEKSAVATGRRALDAWHDDTIAKVDGGFLDQHLSYLNKWGSSARYIYRTALSGSDHAVKELLEEQNKLFQDTVVSDDQLKVSMEAVAEKMADAFTEALDTQFVDIARRYRLSTADLEARMVPLIEVGNSNLLTDGHRMRSRFRMINRALSSTKPYIATAMRELGSITGVEFVHHHAAGAVAKHATKAAAHKAAAGTAKAAATKAGVAMATKGGSVLVSGPFVIVAATCVIAWEWWDHSASVAKRKPELLKQIGDAFSTYEAALLEPSGHLGGVIRQLRSEVEKILTTRGS